VLSNSNFTILDFMEPIKTDEDEMYGISMFTMINCESECDNEPEYNISVKIKDGNDSIEINSIYSRYFDYSWKKHITRDFRVNTREIKVFETCGSFNCKISFFLMFKISMEFTRTTNTTFFLDHIQLYKCYFTFKRLN
jgi:hypothetical protein